MSKKTNKVYILAGVRCCNGNWNADFSKYPKTMGDGRIFGSSYAFKYSVKNYWENLGLPLFSWKSFKPDLTPMNIEEAYINQYGPIVKEVKKKEKKKKKKKGEEVEVEPEVEMEAAADDEVARRAVAKNLLTNIDVLNFGLAFPVKSVNLSFNGVVQVGQGFNVYDETESNIQKVLSPYRNSNKEEAEHSTMGDMVFVDEAHYLYPISVNPRSIEAYVKNLEIEGYTEEAYELLKEGIKNGATSLNSVPKQGCSNELAIFIELVEGSNLYLPNLDKYTTFKKEEKDIYDISKVIDILNNHKDQIKSIEIYTDPYTVEVVTGETDLEITYGPIF